MKNTVMMSVLGLAILAGGTVAGVAAPEAGKQGHPGFEELDANSDGALSRDELQAHMKARFDSVDTNGDGKLSRDELAARGPEKMAKRADKMIKRLDADEDGAVSFDEMQARRGGKMFDRADADSDGVISKAEFDEMREKMHKRHKGHKHGHGDKQGYGDKAKPAE